MPESPSVPALRSAQPDALSPSPSDAPERAAASGPASAAVPRWAVPAALGGGVAVALLAGLGGAFAPIAIWLAQPLLALAVSWRRRTRAWAGGAAWRGEAGRLLKFWALGVAGAGLVLAWPLWALAEGGSLRAALGLATAATLVLAGFWRSWPVWRELERGPSPEPARADAIPEPHAWRGLGMAALAAVPTVAAWWLAWPDLLEPGQRWIAAAVHALLLPPIHAALQSVAVPARPVPADAMDVSAPAVDAAPIPAVADGDLEEQLYEAARAGRVELALRLIEAGADPHARPAPEARDQRSLVALAAVLPDLRLLRVLIGHGIDLNDPAAGMAPLLAATRDSWHGRPEAVMTLLANGADPRVTDAEGNTPLHHAARSTDPGVAALLRDAAAEMDSLNHEGWSPLGVACLAGNWRLAKFLLERGARPEPAGGQPALLAAASGEDDDPVGVQLLLKHKARADASDGRGRTALMEAAYAGHDEIAAALLAAGADVGARDQAGRTPLLETARAGRLGVLERLVEAEADVVCTDADGRNALMLACAAETVSPVLVRRLLELGTDPDQADASGRRAIDLAAESGRWAIVAALDPAYPLPTAVGAAEPGQEPGAAVPDRAPSALIRDGLRADRHDDLDALARLCSPSELGSLLHDPELALAPARLQRLLAWGADPEVRDARGDTPLFSLLARGEPAVPGLRVLLQQATSPAGAGGLARFLAACAAHQDRPSPEAEALALEMLARGADPFGPSAAGDPPLALAVRLDWLEVLERLLETGVDREGRDGHGMTALHLAAALGRERALKRLIAHGASPQTRAADGQTPLGVALASGRRDLAGWLDWRVWPLPRRALRPADVPAAAMAGDVDAVRRLLDLGLPVDTVDAQGCSGLLRAAGGGHGAVVDLLLARGADPQLAADSGATPLSAAVSMRHAEIVDALLRAGAQIEHRLPGGVTVLMLACALGLPDIAGRLLQAGANVHAGDAQGLAPLHCAALYGFTSRDRACLVALLDTLLLAGAEPDQIAAGAVTPLLLLLGARAEPGTACDEETVLAGVERLMDEEVSLDVQDPRGFGPLHLAALHGLLRAVQRLLRTGADPDLRDSLNRSPREIAVMRGFVDVAAEFAPAVPGISMARFLREPRND